MAYTASTAFLEALNEAGVSYIFSNFGSDHPALVEAMAEARAHSRKMPAVVTCPNEMVALSAAHGYAQVTGRPQAVIVHVECGTQALAGAMHNASRARIPVLIFAGVTPYTQEGELKGTRNEWIQWIQDVPDQRGIVRQYVKFDYDLRTGRNVKQIVHRAMQIAQSDPQGPTYIAGAREVMEEEVEPVATDPGQWRPVARAALADSEAAALAEALASAEHPLVVTSYLGRNPTAVPELVRLCERLGMGVLEAAPTHVNFPHDHPLYQGNTWSEPKQNEALAAADLVLVIDSDHPWIPSISRPAADARVFHLDVDALKPGIPLWYVPAERSFQADAATALAQINAHLEAVPASRTGEASRVRHAERSKVRNAEFAARETGQDGIITPESLTAALRPFIDADTIVLSEGITNYPTIANHLGTLPPGSFYLSGGSSLGWHGGAAIGAKLAHPEKTIVALTGDGSFMFSVPSSVHWIARRYKTPFVQIIYNNRGWRSPKMSVLLVHPHGYFSRENENDMSFDPAPDYSGIAAAAGGAHARKVERPDELDAAIAEAFRVVREEKRCAVLDVWLPHL